MKTLHNFGSIIVEKILIVITSVTLCVIGFTFLTNYINTSVTEHNSVYNVVNLNNYTNKSKNIEVTSNSIKVATDKKIARVFIDFVGPKGWTHCGYPNRMCEVRSDTKYMYFQFSVDRNTWFTVGYNCEHLQGKKFWWSCDISPDNKEVTNIRIGTKDAPIEPVFPIAIIKTSEKNEEM